MNDTGMLEEHQAPSQTTETSPTGHAPSNEEKALVKKINKMLEKAKAHRSKYDERANDFYKMFRGKQWKEQRPSYRHSEVFNFVVQTIRSQVPILTDPRPKFEFLPEEPSDYEFSQIINECAEADWAKNNWSMVLSEMAYDARIYGTAIGAMEHDPKARYGVGNECFSSVDPMHCYPDPSAEDINHKTCKYWIEAKPVDVEVLKVEYPEKAQFIKPDLLDLSQGDKTDLTQIKFRSPTDNKSVMEGGSATDSAQRNKALKITCWWYPDEISEEKQLDGSTVVKKAYPNGRKTVICGAVVLEDGPNKRDDGKIPRAKLINGMLPREFWGMSEVEPIEGPQIAFNKVFSFALDVLTLMGNPIWVVDNDSDVDTDNLFNRPGMIVEKSKGSEVRREEGVQLQPYVLQIAEKIREFIDSIAGSNDVTRGVRPEGITAASAISNLQEAAQTRIREQSRFLDACLQNLGQLYLSDLLQYSPAPRIVRITNNQNAEKYFKMSIEPQLDEQGQEMLDESGRPVRVAKVTNYEFNPLNKRYDQLEEKKYQIKGEFDVRVSTGSTLGFEKDRRFGQAKDLFEAGAIDEVELLKAADYPNWEAVWERVKQARAEAAEAQAAQEPMPPPNG